MPSSKLRVLATLRARPETVGELGALLRGLLEPTRREPGSLHYELWHSSDDPTEYTFVEEWADDAALAAHFETPHIKAALEKLPALLASDLDLRRYELAE